MRSLISVILAALISATAHAAAAVNCADLSQAKPVTAAFCRVAGEIRPTPDSNIKFEVWLPLSGWTGRYESVGNGGFAGFIRYDSMLNPLLAGSVVASTDDGHDGPAIGPHAADWAFGHPERIIDYGYRAVHLTAVAGKAITAAFSVADAVAVSRVLFEAGLRMQARIDCLRTEEAASLEARASGLAIPRQTRDPLLDECHALAMRG
jgi:hypothetical protein